MSLSVMTLSAAAVALLGLGYLILFALSRTGGQADIARGLWPHLIEETVVVLGLCAVFLAPPIVLTAFLILLAARIGFEVGITCLGRRAGLACAAVTALLAAIPLGLPAGPTITLLGLLWLGAMGARLLRKGGGADASAMILDLLAFPILPLAVFAAGTQMPHGPVLLLAAYLLIETFDSYALLFGKTLGKRHLFPVLSPKKTLEGLLGGVAMLVLTTVLAAFFFDDIAAGSAALFATLIAFGAVAGDLSASRLKRQAGVKDFPVLLPRFGGALDHVDSWIVTGALLTLALALSPMGSAP